MAGLYVKVRSGKYSHLDYNFSHSHTACQLTPVITPEEFIPFCLIVLCEYCGNFAFDVR